MGINYLATAFSIREKFKEYIQENRIQNVVIGISGGVDSTTVAALLAPACKELGIGLIGRSITIGSNKPDEIARAKAVGEAFCTDFQEIDATEMYESTLKYFEEYSTGELTPIDKGNLKARDRMKILYMLARQNGGIVLSTDNKTEFELAFWTLHGDVGDLGVIQDLWKTEVYDLAEAIAKSDEVTKEQADAIMATVVCNATDGLGISSTDLDQIMPDWKDRHSNTRGGFVEVDNKLTVLLRNRANPEYPKVFMTQDPVILRNLRTDGKRKSPVNFAAKDIVVRG